MTVQYYGPATASKNLFNEQLIDNPPAVIAIDTETISLKERMPIGFAIATSPHEAWWFDTLPERDYEIELLQSLMTDPSVRKVYANVMFDVKVQELIFLNFPFDTRNIVDILTWARILGRTNAKVSELAGEIGRETRDAKEMLDEYGVKSMLKLPHEEVASKCAEDAMVTLALHNYLEPKVKAIEGLSEDYLDVERKVVPVLIDMSQRGLAIDQDARQRMETRMEIEKQFYINLCKEYDFNPGSGMQAGYILAKRGSMLPLTKSKKQYKTDEDTLEKLDDPLAAAVLGYKRVNSILTKYLYPLRDLDRLFTNYGIDTEVGRTKSSNFNMQNVPSEKSRVGIDVRHIFYPDSGVFTTGDYCLAPETRVLTTDLRWLKLRDVEEGESLIGIDEFPPGGKGQRRKLRESIVFRKAYVNKKAFRVVLSDGRTVISSSEHPWLAYKKHDTGFEWKTTGNLKPGNKIKQLIKPFDVNTSHDAGYLAGFLDGEGWVDQHKSNTVGVAQNEGHVISKIEELLVKALGFKLSTSAQATEKYYEYKRGKLRNLRMLKISNQRDVIRLLGTVRPERLIDNFSVEGREPGDKECFGTVIAVEDLSTEIEMINIETTSKTFIAEGLFTHNSQEHLRILMHMSGDKEMERVYYDGKDEGDIHKSTMRKINKPRSIAKILNYSTPYGGSPQMLAQTLKTRDIRWCSSLIDEWFDAYPDAAAWIRAARKYAIAHGKSLPTLFGRQIAIPEEYNRWGKLNQDAMERKGVNYPIIGTDGEVMKRALIICEEEGLPLAVTVHDSITCLHPSTKVLTTYLEWVTLDEVAVGDWLIGIDEYGTEHDKYRRRLKPTEVLAKVARQCTAYKLVFNNGVSVVASADHRWLQVDKMFLSKTIPHTSGYKYRKYTNWSRTDELKIGSNIKFLAKPWDIKDTWDAGYLAGLLDGEGTTGVRSLNFTQNEGLVLEKYIELINSIVNNPGRYNRADKLEAKTISINNIEDYLTVIGSVRPLRILNERAEKLWVGKPPYSKVKVVSIEEVGKKLLLDIRTSTKTFIAEGLITHNCDGDIEFPLDKLQTLAPVHLPFEVERTERWK